MSDHMMDATTNVDESHVTDYALPELMTFNDRTPVTTVSQWREFRRPEMLGQFEQAVYGRTPDVTGLIDSETVKSDLRALDGRALISEICLRVGPEARPVNVLLFLPKQAARPVPVFCALNLLGNHSIVHEPAITLSPGWVPAQDPHDPKPDRGFGVVGNRATEESRGCQARRWPLSTIIERGYGFATVHTSDLSPDYGDGFATGVAPTIRTGDSNPPGSRWGKIGMWAWGLSRVLDYLVTDARIDPHRVGVLGHSRTGKTALWAAAQDERFAFAIANQSGHAGAALTRRNFGESIEAITRRFGYWFAEDYRRYIGHEYALPIDQHQLLALIAPRPLYVAAAEEDLWADPKGQFLAAYEAGEAYRLHGREGLATDVMPAVDRPVDSLVSYHIRSGGHDLTAYDWERYLDFADRWLPT